MSIELPVLGNRAGGSPCSASTPRRSGTALWPRPARQGSPESLHGIPRWRCRSRSPCSRPRPAGRHTADCGRTTGESGGVAPAAGRRASRRRRRPPAGGRGPAGRRGFTGLDWRLQQPDQGVDLVGQPPDALADGRELLRQLRDPHRVVIEPFAHRVQRAVQLVDQELADRQNPSHWPPPCRRGACSWRRASRSSWFMASCRRLTCSCSIRRSAVNCRCSRFWARAAGGASSRRQKARMRLFRIVSNPAPDLSGAITLLLTSPSA